MKKIILILIVIVIVLALAVAFVSLRGGLSPKKPNVVLVVIDTLRADHAGCYGYKRPTTPAIDKIAASATLFENAIAPSSWTVPSMATIFTGLEPQRHGVVEGLQMFGQVTFQHMLNEQYNTLAERLTAAGYTGFGYSANAHTIPQTGFAQGFAQYQSVPTANSEEIERLVFDDLEKIGKLNAKGTPYFLFLHLFDPHVPYQVREPFNKVVAPEQDYKLLSAIPADLGDLNNGLPAGYFNDHPKELQVLIDAYDSEIAAADASVGRLLDKLPNLQNTVVVILSDHGESFYEHETMLHGYNLYQETLRVPLVIKAPVKGKAAPVATKIATPVSLIDIMPTILHFAGIKTTDLPGVDLTGVIPENRMFPLHLKRGENFQSYGAVAYPLKRLVEMHTKKDMLFDLAADPLEKKNLLGEKTVPDALEKAAKDAWDLRPFYPAELVTNPTVGNADQLKALGYTSPGAGPAGSQVVSPTPGVVPWVVELPVCKEVRAIAKDCGAKPAEKKDGCVKERLDALKAKTCSNASSFNYRKKCEFMRLEQTLRKCSEAEEQGHKVE